MVNRITKKNKRAQEEIVGFAMIVIIVSIILIFFLVFSLSEKTETESYEAESFLQSSLHYTSSCAYDEKYLSVQDLIFSCYAEKKCDNEEEACDVLNETLKGMLDEGWRTGEDSPVKGYNLTILLEKELIISIEEGNVTKSYKGAQQQIPRGSGASVRVLFNLYY